MLSGCTCLVSYGVVGGKFETRLLELVNQIFGHSPMILIIAAFLWVSSLTVLFQRVVVF